MCVYTNYWLSMIPATLCLPCPFCRFIDLCDLMNELAQWTIYRVITIVTLVIIEEFPHGDFNYPDKGLQDWWLTSV